MIDFEGVNFIDSQGSDKVSQLFDLAEASGIELRLARVKPHVLALLGRDGVIEKLGENRIYDSVYSAVEDHIPEATES